MFLASARKQSGWCYYCILPSRARLVNADVTGDIEAERGPKINPRNLR